MVTEINIYIEGGGDSRQTKSKLRQGFHEFLRELVEIARQNGIGWKLVACGGRNSAYEAFCTALRANPDVFNALLVDSEEAIAEVPSRLKGKQKNTNTRFWTHLTQRDGWDRPQGTDDDCCFLMAQSMETWLVVDRQALARFYGQGFNPKALPATNDIEAVDKDKLIKALTAATAKTESKGPYHKTQHGFDILTKADPVIVRKAASHCKRLFVNLSRTMGAEITDE